MRIRTSLSCSLVAGIALATFVLMAGTTGCNNDAPETNASTSSATCDGAKCDAFNEHTDPKTLGFTIKYELADESMIGVPLKSDLTPYYAQSYYPFTTDGINLRANGGGSSTTPSPAEKYDMAFSGWTPPEGFFELKRLARSVDTEFDQAYYDGLGPVALWEHNEHGLGRLHDGVDNDGDGETDFDDEDREGLESWFGYCNGNTAASMSVPRPLHSVTYEDIEFTKGDIIALLAAVHYGDRSTVSGLRCESLNAATDKWGRHVDQPWVKVTLAEGAAEGTPEPEMVFFEVEAGPMYFDATRDKVMYRVILLEDEPTTAVIRLTLEEFEKYRADIKTGELTRDGRDYEPITFSTSGRGCRDTNPGMLYLAVTHLLGKYKIPFGIDADAESHVWNYPINAAIINEQRIVELTEANRLLGVPEDEPYLFNDEAAGFAYVKLSLTAQHHMSLEMILELDREQRVIGGEWVGGSKTKHPDFVWVAMGADDTGFNTEGVYMTFGDDQLDGRELQDGSVDYTDAPDMAYSAVRRLLAESLTKDDESFAAYDGEGADLPQGHTTTLTVEVPAETPADVTDTLVYIDAEAAFTPGVEIDIIAPDGSRVKVFDIPTETPEWAAGRFPVGWDLGVIKGVAHPMPLVSEDGVVYPGLQALDGAAAAGTWTLEVRNAGGGAAKVKSWSLWLTTKPQQVDPPAEE